MVSTPSPPNPLTTANQQQGFNQQAAIDTSYLGNVNQVTPYGSINYTSSPRQGFGTKWDPVQHKMVPDSTWGADTSGIPQITATTSLSPAVQGLVDQGIANATGSANLESQLQTNAGPAITKPLDLSWGATEANLNQLSSHTLDPQYAQLQTQLNQQLTDQGLTPGSEGYNFQQTQFGNERANAYNAATLANHQQAVSDLTAQYNSPLNALASLQSGSQIQQPGIGQLAPVTPNTQIQPPNYAGLVEQNYQQQSQNANAAMGGLFGLGGSVLGGLGSLIGSDREDKTDIKPLGKDKQSGLKMYAYRYKDDPKTYPKTVGPMAQDIEKTRPGAVREIGGHKVVNFGLGGRV